MRNAGDPLMTVRPTRPTRSNPSGGCERPEGDLPLFAPPEVGDAPGSHELTARRINPVAYASADESIDARFARFHAAHPEVYDRFADYALRALCSGRKVGAKAIWERLRWELEVERPAAGFDDASGGYKLNNDFTSRYARLLAERDPRFAEFFEFRTLKSCPA